MATLAVYRTASRSQCTLDARTISEQRVRFSLTIYPNNSNMGNLGNGQRRVVFSCSLLRPVQSESSLNHLSELIKFWLSDMLDDGSSLSLRLLIESATSW